MAPPAFNFNVFMEKEKLAANGSNFTNWAMNLRILHTAAQKQYVLEAPLGPPPAPDAPDEEKERLYNSSGGPQLSSLRHTVWARARTSKAFRKWQCL